MGNEKNEHGNYGSIIINLPAKYKEYYNQILSDLEEKNAEKNPAVTILAKEIALHKAIQKLILDSKLTQIKKQGEDRDGIRLVKIANALEEVFSKGSYDMVSHSKVIESMLTKFTNLTVMKQRETGRMVGFVNNCIMIIKKNLPKGSEFELMVKKIKKEMNDEITMSLS